jgi:hypothetical protein
MSTDHQHRPDDPLDALFRAARENAGDHSRVEFGFETRTLARIREDRSSSWFAWAVRLCPFAAVLAIGAGVWAYAHWEDSPDGDSVVNAVRLAGVPVLDYYLGGEQ